MHKKIFDRLSFLSLFIVIVLLPFFFLPLTNIPIENSKGLLLVAGLLVCIVCWAIARFLDGKVILPKSWLLVSGLGVVLAFLLSAFLSVKSQVSWFGIMFDIGSFWFIFSAFVLMLMCSIIFRTSKQARIVLFGIIASSVFVLVFQGLHLFMPNILSLGVLSGKTTNLLGSWSALGIFAGFTGLLSLLVVEFFQISKNKKILFIILILLSILLIATVNFPLIWVLLGISSLMIFVYKVSIALQKNEEEKKNFPLISFVVAMVALLFFLNPLIPLPSGPVYLKDVISNTLKISNTEVSPSFSATMSVTKGVLSKNPFFGIGPNRFDEAWAMYKPVSINSTQFWGDSFSSGSGLLPTLFSTTGYLGILAWVVFLGLLIFTGVKSVFSGIKNEVNLEIMSFFVLSLYLFVSSFFYSTGVVLFLLSLAFTGIFIGLTSSNQGKEISFSFLNDHRKSFFSILFLIILIIISAALSFKYVERLVSVFYFQKALTSSTVPLAESSINKSLTLYVNDLYLRTYAQIYLIKLNSIVNKGATLSDNDKADLQVSFDQAVNSAQLATKSNTSSYLNFQSLGLVYQTAGGLGVKDAYGKAVEAYKVASSLNPNNPGLKLNIASNLFIDGNVKDAKDYASQALSLKPDYIDALLVLSQIAKSEGNNTEALSYAERALLISPSNENLIKYVDSLKTPKNSTSDSVNKTPTTNTKKP